MFGVRQAFDPAGPFVVATSELVCHVGRLKRGALFPVAGLSDLDVLQLWNALKIDMAPVKESPRPPDLDLDRMTPEQLAELEAATAPPPIPVVTTRAPAAVLSTPEQPRAGRIPRRGR